MPEMGYKLETGGMDTVAIRATVVRSSKVDVQQKRANLIELRE